ncbi:MAG: hypothetical protein KF784_03620 [Fimbriimonadaceae bacterium]|nr:hypothetical protein [Fimbriimonadaceae bacterium]
MKRAPKLLGLMVGGAALVAFVFYFGVRQRAVGPYQAAANELATLEKEAASLGLPFTEEQLYQLKPLAETDNAADKFMKARLVFRELRDQHFAIYNDSWPSRLTYGNELDKQAVVKEIKQFEPLFAAYSQATQRPWLRLKRDWEKPGTFNYELPMVTDTVRFCSDRAVALALLGRSAEAIESLRVAYSLTRALAYDLGVMGMFTQLNAYTIVDKSACALATTFFNQSDMLERLRETVEWGRIAVDPEWTLAGEFFVSYMQYRATARRSAEIDQMPGSLSVEGVFGPEDREAPASVSESLLQGALQARHVSAFNSGVKRFKETKNLNEFGAAYRQSTAVGVKQTDRTYSLAQENSEFYDLLGDAVMQCKARLNVLLATIEVAKFKHRTGRLPKDLVEAGISLGDPFGSGPLSYRLDDSTAMIYSLGRNRIDDNGSSVSNSDIVMKFPTVIKRQ